MYYLPAHFWPPVVEIRWHPALFLIIFKGHKSWRHKLFLHLLENDSYGSSMIIKLALIAQKSNSTSVKILLPYPGWTVLWYYRLICSSPTKIRQKQRSPQSDIQIHVRFLLHVWEKFKQSLESAQNSAKQNSEGSHKNKEDLACCRHLHQGVLRGSEEYVVQGDGWDSGALNSCSCRKHWNKHQASRL